jgi:hypothetical protein
MRCGAKRPADAQAFGCGIAIFLVAALLFFLGPAILFLFVVEDHDLAKAADRAIGSGPCWIASAVFWAMIGVAYLTSKNQPKRTARKVRTNTQDRATTRRQQVSRQMGAVEGVEYDEQYYEKERRLLNKDDGFVPPQIAPRPEPKPPSTRSGPVKPSDRRNIRKYRQ